MKVFKTKEELNLYLKEFRSKNAKIGFVPTMGALHKGHLSLLEKSSRENDISVASIFVNPTQFNKKEDLDNYPRTLENDLKLLKNTNCNVVFIPSTHEIYSEAVSSGQFNFDGLENEMEGKYREGHFNGVGTIVKKLFEIVLPTHAYFGEKDFQQLQIIKKMVELHEFITKIVGCAIYRADDGLAMSSRNERLKPNYRKAAPFIYKTLKEAKKKFGTDSAKEVTEWVENQFKKHELLELEYFLIADIKTLKPVKRKSTKKTYRAFIAAYADDIRLIDNIALN